MSALLWFNADPAFYEASTSRAIAEKDFELLTQFAGRIKSDSKFWTKEGEVEKKKERPSIVVGSSKESSAPNSRPSSRKETNKREVLSRQSLMESSSVRSGGGQTRSSIAFETSSFASFDSLGTSSTSRG